VSHIGLLFFLLAVGMLYWQLRSRSISDILDFMTDIPIVNIICALVLCVAEYLTLSCYDCLALHYIGKKLRWWKWMLAGMMGFVISNNAGNAAISGGAIRYRLYTRWRIKAGDIVKMLTFSGFTYYLGAAAVVVAGYNLLPDETVAMTVMLFGCCVFLAAYFGSCLFFQGKTFKIGQLAFRVPSLATAITQTALGMTDSILAGLVLYFLTMHIAPISVVQFVAIFVVAQSAGIFAQVPGGIGVFEGVVMLVMPESVDQAALFGSLIAFRIVYYLVPLVSVGTTFFIYEGGLKSKMKKWKIFQPVGKIRKKR